MATQGFVSWDVFLPEILQYVNGAPTILVRQHIRKTILDFCERSLILKRNPSSLTLDEGEAIYTLKYSQDRYVVIDVDEARFETEEGDPPEKTNQPLIKTTEHLLDSELANWRQQKASRPTRFFLTENVNEIYFFPKPNQDIEKDLVLRTRVRPKLDQEEFDEVLYEKWHEAIENGTIARLLLNKGATWYAPDLAAVASADYRRDVRRARKTSTTGTGTHPGQVVPQDYVNVGWADNRTAGSWV